MVKVWNVGVAIAKLVWQWPHQPYGELHPCTWPTNTWRCPGDRSQENSFVGIVVPKEYTIRLGLINFGTPCSWRTLLSGRVHQVLQQWVVDVNVQLVVQHLLQLGGRDAAVAVLVGQTKHHLQLWTEKQLYNECFMVKTTIRFFEPNQPWTIVF